jgi:phosphoglucosamine mutase
MKKLFGTDGVRGMANRDLMTPEMAMALGQAIARTFQHAKTTHRIIIGKDTRRSSYMIELAMAAGLCSMGSNAVLLGPISTPGVAFLTKAMRADVGVMISASHNPFYDNGIKFFDHDGYKLSDEIEMRVEKIVADGIPPEDRPMREAIGKAYRVDDAMGRYVEFVKATFPKELTLDGIKIVIDCAHGAAYKSAPMTLWELGAEVIPLGVKPNGLNINHLSGALHPEVMCQTLVAEKAKIGIALDGDADRVILCDEKGDVVDGDKIMALCAIELKNKNQLEKNSVVGTVLTNMGVENYLGEHGIGLIRSRVGDRYIIESMREQGILLGGEPSGHLIFAQHSTTGDGLIAALQVLSIMVQTGKALSELVKDIPLYPQVTQNIKVKERRPLESVIPLQAALSDLKKRSGKKMRVVMRYSGTEALLRLMIVGENQSLIEKELGQLAQVAVDQLGRA